MSNAGFLDLHLIKGPIQQPEALLKGQTVSLTFLQDLLRNIEKPLKDFICHR